MDDDQSLAQLMNEQNQELNQLDASQGLPPPPGGGANAGSRTSKGWMVAGVALVVVAIAVAIYFYEKSKSASSASNSSQAMDYTATNGSTTSSGSHTTNVSAANPTLAASGTVPSPAPAQKAAAKQSAAAVASSPPVLGPGSTVSQGSLPSTGHGATTKSAKEPAAKQSSAIKGYTPTHVAIINNAASHAAQRSLLASGAPVAIPGHSAAINTFDKNMAKAGAISGITKNNVVILNKGTSYNNAVRVLDSQQGVALNAGLTPAEAGKIQSQARHGTLTKSAYQYDITHHTAINTAPKQKAPTRKKTTFHLLGKRFVI